MSLERQKLHLQLHANNDMHISFLRTCICANNIQKTEVAKKDLEPVSSTSRRGARAAYLDEYPRDFGPRIAYTVS